MSIRFFFTIALALTLSTTFAQKSPVKAGSANMSSIKQDISNIKEVNADYYKSVNSYTNGKPAKKATLPTDVAIKEFKLAVLFNKSITWTKPLADNQLKVSDDKFNAVLTKYGLKLSKYYEADQTQEGLIIKVIDDKCNLVEAATELSKISGINIVYLKSPK